ncbi:hypothetical protein PF006_g27737 [Phytophthora fragariae]|uniref:Uncharacterized protein n=1 Tax=Phytophthora fragariae TaxID=53985 RepID=A0A6A3QLJ6_9STRA|nr:hypothetical protein PF006_g27737 [Phytophthora fragariae]KAE9331742.1 hypothetical protein PF008_g15280 [Phytophthora fragariae]
MTLRPRRPTSRRWRSGGGSTTLHVVELFGASHVSTPAFFVCEDAIHGNFADHFKEGKSEI